MSFDESIEELKKEILSQKQYILDTVNNLFQDVNILDIIVGGGYNGSFILNKMYQYPMRNNDIDIFVITDRNTSVDEQVYYKTQGVRIIHRHTIMSPSSNKYDFMECVPHHINAKYRVDDICKSIVDTYDINMIQCGMFLLSKKIYYTEVFEIFFKTKELNIVSKGTPEKSLLRIINKLYTNPELYCNIDKNYSLISVYTNAKHAEITRKKIDSYSEKTLDKFKEYFHIICAKSDKYPKKEDDIFIILNKRVLFHLEPDSIMLFSISNPRRYNKYKYIFDYLKSDIDYSISTRIMDNIMYNRNFVDMPIRLNELRSIILFFNKHYSLFGSIFSFRYAKNKNTNAIEILEIKHKYHDIIHKYSNYLKMYKVFKYINKNISTSIIGYVESDEIFNKLMLNKNMFSSEYIEYTDQNDIINDFIDINNEYEKTVQQENVDSLCVDDKFSINGFQVKQIINRLELVKEGKAMEHCVGGYWRSVSEQTSFIFSIRNIDGRTTVEFNKVYIPELSIRIGQIRGKNNTEPPQSHLRYVEEVMLPEILKTEKIKSILKKSTYTEMENISQMDDM